MSTPSSLERAEARIKAVLHEDIHDALAHPLSALVQYRAVIAAQRELEQVQMLLAQVEEGLKTAATEEWERVAHGRHPEA